MRKKYLLFIILLCHVYIGRAQINVHVDERFELTSIIFALAGVPEFCESKIPSYKQDIISYFTPYELTKPVEFVRELNQKYHIGFNAVSNATAHLEIKKGRITLSHKYNISNLIEIDSRWNEELFMEYINMLNQFYKESNFNKFFNNHKSIYEIAEQRINKYLVDFNIEWLNSFYGKVDSLDVDIYISLVNGRHNYAFPGGVIIGVKGDENGLPAPNSQTLPVLAHEISHHYSNLIFYSFWDEMTDAANRIYPFVKKQMHQSGYSNPQTMVLEWLNNLFVLLYLKQINYKPLEFELANNIHKGFIWMKSSMDFMNNFYLNRERYPSIEDFMPQLISFLQYKANNFEFVMKEFEYSKPYITNIFPAPGASLEGFDQIIITFSQPMNNSYGFSGIPPECKPLPVDFNNIKWSDDKYNFIIKLESKMGKQDKDDKFGFTLNPNSFQSSAFCKLNNDVNCNIVFF
ncbi:DUF4932 domain-containing protein [Bacteroidia bacterium]|nr:DUF4932 domain-containing protein [Bacteroidia bacterium]GHV40303.1 DUF4932 domain-containing protein [Bacteroidia bacterium]